MCAVLELRWEDVKKKRKSAVGYCSCYNLRLDAQWARGCLDCPRIVQKKKEDLERGEGRKRGWWTQSILRIACGNSALIRSSG